MRKVLYDLDVSINLMPLSVFKPLGIGAVRPTTITLQLAEGKIEDVVVKVDKFIFLANFIILDDEADIEVPIILGRPFLATGQMPIDVKKRELSMQVNKEKVVFNVFNAMKYHDDTSK